jgi:hypothetical protein
MIATDYTLTLDEVLSQITAVFPGAVPEVSATPSATHVTFRVWQFEITIYVTTAKVTSTDKVGEGLYLFRQGTGSSQILIRRFPVLHEHDVYEGLSQARRHLEGVVAAITMTYEF